MAPGPLLDSLTSSRTSSHSNLRNTRPRHAIPIVPIVPRKLENKRGQSPRGVKQSTPYDSKNEESIDLEAETRPPSVHGAVPLEETGAVSDHESRTQGTSRGIINIGIGNSTNTMARSPESLCELS